MSASTGARDLSKLNVGFIGGGNMAYAIAAGLFKTGVLQPNQVIVSATNLNNLRVRWNPLGVTRVTTSNAQVLQEAEIVFLCVKPHVLPACKESILVEAESIQHLASHCHEKVMVSILAGVTLARLKDTFSFLNIQHVRTMPNTPMQVGAGCTIYSAGFGKHCPGIVLSYYEDIKFMLNQLGLAYEVNEAQMDGITGLTGCGPAFVYEIIEALADGGVKQGIARDMALKMAAQTVMGAAKTVLETGKHPAVLKDEVCSPGGATIHGVHELEKGAMRATLMNAVEKSAARAKELS
uniref:Pyrroline-5-carboxylate reductase n=1 Tax=Aedes aegypti TaxID=7159 RepID=Q2KQA2_AEDAE|nr:pyrroline-5-carboxylate reductase [Aedes aegypti]